MGYSWEFEKRKRETITLIHVRNASIVYILLPLFCFACGFLRWYYSFICIVVILYSAYTAMRSENIENQFVDQHFGFTNMTTIVLFLFSMLWTYLAGMNGFYFQSSDWDCRNAVYFDLIRYDWPVVYTKNGTALVYYIGHWLPPALIAKVFQSLTGSIEAGRMAGRMLLWIWSSIGLTLVLLLILQFVNAGTGKKKTIALFLFAFFSGLDIIGALLRDRLGFCLSPEILHLEWWMPGVQYSSITTCLFWVFNQTIIPWLITLLFLVEKNSRNYIFYGTICLLCGSFPCVGLVLLMIVKTVKSFFDNKTRRPIGHVMRQILSAQNVLSLFFLFPVVSAYILSANTVGNSLGAENSQPFFFLNYKPGSIIAFIVLEVGLYMLCIWTDHRKDPIYYCIGVTFVIAPFIHVGSSHDFCMRASIPGILILSLYVIRFLMEHFSANSKKENGGTNRVARVLSTALIICFLIGSATPFVELYRGAYNVVTSHTLFLENQTLMTFNREEIIDNFLSSRAGDSFFFKYLSKTQYN